MNERESVFVRVKERERGSVCVRCVCVCKRERDREKRGERGSVCLCERKREEILANVVAVDAAFLVFVFSVSFFPSNGFVFDSQEEEATNGSNGMLYN